MTRFEKDGLSYAVEIERKVEPKGWPAALESVPENVRPEAENYLRGVAARMRAIRKMMRECGCYTQREWNDFKARAKRAGAPSARAWYRAGTPEKFRK